MDLNWNATGYREVINDYLGYRSARRPRGAVKGLAEKLGCHPTFIAQVLKETADFSLEQACEFCGHFSLSMEEQDFFLNLVLRDRAGTKTLKRYYQDKIDRAIEAKRDLKPKTQANLGHPGGPTEAEYFGNWVYQVIHAMTQIDRFQSVQAISKDLNRSEEEVLAILTRLQEMNLVKREKTLWKSTVHSLHLPKGSYFIRYLHATWKTKLLADLQSGQPIDGTRYSGLITVTEKDYQKVRDVLTRAIIDIRNIVESSSPENVYVLSVDFYKNQYSRG
ncbi:hypothetical protein D3C87_162530 [compost metagenome]